MSCCSWSSDGRRLFSGSEDFSVAYRDLDRADMDDGRTFRFESTVSSVSANPCDK